MADDIAVAVRADLEEDGDIARIEMFGELGSEVDLAVFDVVGRPAGAPGIGGDGVAFAHALDRLGPEIEAAPFAPGFEQPCIPAVARLPRSLRQGQITLDLRICGSGPQSRWEKTHREVVRRRISLRVLSVERGTTPKFSAMQRFHRGTEALAPS